MLLNFSLLFVNVYHFIYHGRVYTVIYTYSRKDYVQSLFKYKYINVCVNKYYKSPRRNVVYNLSIYND